MALFALKSQSQTCTLDAPEQDHRAARRVGQYRLGREAIYFPAFPGTRYLPFGALSRALSKNSAIAVTGCCGKELPVVRLRAFYDGSFYQDFLFEKQAQADLVLEAIRTSRPEVPLDRDLTPRL